MKIHAFQIRETSARPLRDLVEMLMARPLQERTFSGSAGMRLEEANTAGDLVYLDFARPRVGHGPGKMTRTLPMEDILLEGGATFGEDTAMVYDPRIGFGAIQFNPYGPRPPALQQYLSLADLELGLVPGGNGDFGYVFAPRFRPEAFRRLGAFQYVREIEFTISVAGINRADYDSGRSVGSILNANLPGGIQTVSVKLKSGTKKADTLALDAAFAVLSDLEGMGGDLIQGRVKGKAGLDEKPDTVDLVDERLDAEREIARTHGHRFARPERWAALRGALAEWHASGALR